MKDRHIVHTDAGDTIKSSSSVRNGCVTTIYTRRKGSCFILVRKAYRRNLRGQHQQQPQNNKYVYKKKRATTTTTHTQPVFLDWMHCCCTCPPLLVQVASHMALNCTLNKEVQVLPSSYNYEQRMIIRFLPR